MTFILPKTFAVVLVALLLSIFTQGISNAVAVKTGPPAEIVIDLGERVHDGQVVRGILIIDLGNPDAKPDVEDARPSGRGKRGGGGGEVTCFTTFGNGISWKVTEQYLLDTTNVNGMLDGFVESTIDTAMETWDAEVTFDIFGTRAVGVGDGPDYDTPDGRNEISFGDIAAPGAIAQTVTWYIGRGPPSGSSIVEYDIIFDDGDFDFGDAYANSAKWDLEGIAAHELGHGLGLRHPDSSCTKETMYAFASVGEFSKRDLFTGDIAGVKAVYA